MNPTNHFTADLTAFMLRSIPNAHANSLQSIYRFTKSPDVLADQARTDKDAKALAYAKSMGFTEFTARDAEDAVAALAQVWPLASGLSAAYDLMADDSSRQIFIETIAYKILGPQKVRMSVNNADYSRHLQTAEGLRVEEHTARTAMLDGWLDRFDLNKIGFPIVADLHLLSILYTFQLQQYRYSRGPIIEAQPGDVCIDGGGCWGDTALYLACQVGPTGHVHTFEFSPDNLVTLRKNLDRNPELARRITVHEHPLWNEPGVKFDFEANGPATQLNAHGGKLSTTTATIDDLNLPRVDFIKMDIEGAEVQALQGAQKAIRAHRPKLAITVYHRLEDYATIPAFLSGLNLGYSYFMDHFSAKWEETVLFAKP